MFDWVTGNSKRRSVGVRTCSDARGGSEISVIGVVDKIECLNRNDHVVSFLVFERFLKARVNPVVGSAAKAIAFQYPVSIAGIIVDF